jgi:aspartyl/asparaginyl-tRNA synthetase
LAFFDSMVEKGLIARLQDVVEKPFATVTYTEAVKLLQKSGHKFEYPVKWGADLQSEHERFLTEQARLLFLCVCFGGGDGGGRGFAPCHQQASLLL